MSDVKSTVIGAVVGAVITGGVSLLIFYLGDRSTQATVEASTVETLSGYFEFVDKDMEYKQALQSVYESYRSIKAENDKIKNEKDGLQQELTDEKSQMSTEILQLKDQIESMQSEIDANEKNRSIINAANSYADSENYEKAILILKSVKEKTPEMELLMDDYLQIYESDIIIRANALVAEEKFDESHELVSEALKIIPDSKELEIVLNEIENNYPQDMLDVVCAYQNGGGKYYEYIASKSGGAESFAMGGVKYTNGMAFKPWYETCWAVYNLNAEYSSLVFTVCHIDGTSNGEETSLQIFYDGVLKKEVLLTSDMAPQMVPLDVNGAKQLKIQVQKCCDESWYGLGNPILK